MARGMWANNTSLLLGDILASRGYHQTLFSTRVKADPGVRTKMCRNSHLTNHSFSTMTHNKAVLGPFLFKNAILSRRVQRLQLIYGKTPTLLLYSTVVENYSLSEKIAYSPSSWMVPPTFRGLPSYLYSNIPIISGNTLMERSGLY